MTLPQSPFFGVPQQIVDLSGSLADFVERSVGIRPDFTPDTLSLVDHYAQMAREELSHRPELHDLTGQALGAYFGEVLRRSEGALWQIPSPNFHDWRLCGVSAYVTVNPIGVGYDALAGTASHSGPSSQIKLGAEDRQTVAERLANLPPVAEDEYYSLCTRLEVMQIVMAAIRSLQVARGYDELTFTEDDYGNDLKPLGDF